MTSSSILFLFFSLLLTSSFLSLAHCGSFTHDTEITWGDGRGKTSRDGKYLTLSLDKYSGSGFQSKNEYLYGRLDMQIKLIAGNSAGTVTTSYLSSQGPTHDEIDFEFLGNTSGDPYTVHTNVFTQGKGDKEQQFHLWFDQPRTSTPTPSFLVDNIPIRDFKNHESRGLSFPKSQPMRLYSSLWEADDWATRGGLVKTDWSKDPFTAYYQNFKANACVWSSGSSRCSSQSDSMSKNSWYNHKLDSMSYRRMRWVQRKCMIYNYCTDRNRFPRGVPRECRLR